MQAAARELGGDPPAEDACSASCPDSLVDSVTLDPPPATWSSLVRRRPLTDLQRRTREQLGLPTDRPVIMSGHQAEIWHPGILAKWFAGAALADHISGAFTWLHVDQDTNEPGIIEVPALDASGTLVKRSLTLVEPRREIPTGSRPAARINSPAADPTEKSLDASRLKMLIDVLNRHATAPSLAMQFGASVQHFAGSTAHPITTTQLASTDAFAALIEALRRNPVRAIEAHNTAAAQVPEAGIRSLGLKHAASPDQHPRVELPLWRVAPGSPRTPVMLSQLVSIPLAELRPRALLMTAVTRLAVCDLFIHGTGGGIYDRITDLWLEHWLGEGGTSELASSLPLAPVTVATATARIVFGHGHGGASLGDARAATHRAHRARHDPALIGDHAAAHIKSDLVERIRRSTDRAERLLLYRQMHAVLDRSRAACAPALERLRAEASVAARRAAEAPVVAERTWPIALYPESTLAELRSRIERAFEDVH